MRTIVIREIIKRIEEIIIMDIITESEIWVDPESLIIKKTDISPMIIIIAILNPTIRVILHSHILHSHILLVIMELINHILNIIMEVMHLHQPIPLFKIHLQIHMMRMAILQVIIYVFVLKHTMISREDCKK